MEKHGQEEAQTGRKPEERRSEREKVRRHEIREGKSQKRKTQVREQVGKSQSIVFFQRFVAPPGGKAGWKPKMSKTDGDEPTLKCQMSFC